MNGIQTEGSERPEFCKCILETVPAVTPWMMVWDSAPVHFGAETMSVIREAFPHTDAVLC